MPGLLDYMNNADQLVRKPYKSEDDYFSFNPEVTGMATEDGRIITNPYSPLGKNEFNAVRRNEAARLWFRNNGTPKMQLSPEQSAYFKGTSYENASDADRSATVLARILSGDPSVTSTPEQQKIIKYLLDR